MKCWDCGQEIDTVSTERAAIAQERYRIAMAAEESAKVMRSHNERQAANALESLAQELLASPTY